MTSALDIGEAAGVLIGERGGVPEACAAARRGMTTACHGGMAAVAAGPDRGPGPGAVTGVPFLSAGNRSADRLGKWEPGRGATTSPRRPAGQESRGRSSGRSAMTAPARRAGLPSG